MKKLYVNHNRRREIAGMFSSLNGNYDRFEDVGVMTVGTEEDLIRSLEGEREVGLQDNVPSPVPTQKEAEGERFYHQRLDEVMELQSSLAKGFRLYGEMKRWLSDFYDHFPQIKEWYKVREELNSATKLSEKYGMDISATKASFWKQHRSTWLASKKAWETPYGQNASKVHAKIKKVWARIEELLAEKDDLNVTTEEWRKVFNMAKEELTKWNTKSGDLHWSVAHLSEAERWYCLVDLNRSQWEYEQHNALWGKDRY